MLRFAIAATLLLAAAAPAAADPAGLCQLEEQGAQSPPCPPYITYDEDGEEVGTAATSEGR